jgi:hypothetical protein
MSARLLEQRTLPVPFLDDGFVVCRRGYRNQENCQCLFLTKGFGPSRNEELVSAHLSPVGRHLRVRLGSPSVFNRSSNSPFRNCWSICLGVAIPGQPPSELKMEGAFRAVILSEAPSNLLHPEPGQVQFLSQLIL